jgi:hypothetical protein
MRRPHDERFIRRLGAALLGVAGACVMAQPARAAGVGGLVGYEFFTRGNNGDINSILAALALVPSPRGDVVLAASRFDDSRAGVGFGLTGGGGIAIRNSVALRGAATRFLGADDFRAWRLKIGPRLGRPAELNLTTSYLLYRDNAEGASDGVNLELERPFGERFESRASASWARVAAAPHALDASAGLGWMASSSVQLCGEIGVARNGGASGARAYPSRRLVPPLPILGDEPPQDPNDESRTVSLTALVGLRWLFP